MSDDELATLVVCYLGGAFITLMSMDLMSIDAPRLEHVIFRRSALWPFYWVYLLVKMGFMLAHEVRR